MCTCEKCFRFRSFINVKMPIFMLKNSLFCRFRELKSTQKAVLMAVPYWIPTVETVLNSRTMLYKELVFWAPRKMINLGKVQFQYVQSKVDALCKKDKTINVRSINRTVGMFELPENYFQSK